MRSMLSQGIRRAGARGSSRVLHPHSGPARRLAGVGLSALIELRGWPRGAGRQAVAVAARGEKRGSISPRAAPVREALWDMQQSAHRRRCDEIRQTGGQECGPIHNLATWPELDFQTHCDSNRNQSTDRDVERRPAGQDTFSCTCMQYNTLQCGVLAWHLGELVLILECHPPTAAARLERAQAAHISLTRARQATRLHRRRTLAASKPRRLRHHPARWLAVPRGQSPQHPVRQRRAPATGTPPAQHQGSTPFPRRFQRFQRQGSIPSTHSMTLASGSLKNTAGRPEAERV